MFNLLLTVVLSLGSLFVLAPPPTMGFTVKLLGDETYFAEKHVPGALIKKTRTPIPGGTDAFPDPNGIKTLRREIDPSPNGPKFIKNNIEEDEKDIENSATDNYLIKYGYLKPDAIDMIDDADREAALKAFQHYAGLKVTGVVDEKTKEQMFVPRCGLQDPVFGNKAENFEAAAKWSKKDLTYKIIKYSEKLDRENTRELIVEALQMWSRAADLKFTEVDSDDFDLSFSFVKRDHGDGAPFDGSGGVLGHAFYPESGRIHLDDDEKFTIGTEEGVNLLFVLVHEIGHALGLGHSDIDDAIMGPYYYGYTPDLKLSSDDIAGIQHIYGPPQPELPPTKAPATNAPPTQPPATKAPPTQPPATNAPPTQPPATKAPPTQPPATNAPPTQPPATKAPPTQPPATKAPPTQHPATNAPPTQPPATKAPPTQPPATKAPPTQPPATNAPPTQPPATKPPPTQPPVTKPPPTQPPATKAPPTKPEATNAPPTQPPATKAPPTQPPATKAPPTTASPTTEPTPPEPTPPARIFPCPFRFWASMASRNKTYGFFRRFVYEIYPDGSSARLGRIRKIFPRGPRTVGAAAFNQDSEQTFLFQGRKAYRFTNNKLDRGFPKRLPTFIRNAMVVDGLLIAFSFHHVHYLDPDTMDDMVDGELTIDEEYPDLPYRIRSSLSIDDGEAYMLYRQKVIKLDIFTGEMEVTNCRDRLTAATATAAAGSTQ